MDDWIHVISDLIESVASGRHQTKLLKQLFAPTLGISPSPSPLPFLSPPSSVTVWQQQLSILEGGVAACQSAARAGLSPAHPSLLPVHNQ